MWLQVKQEVLVKIDWSTNHKNTNLFLTMLILSITLSTNLSRAALSKQGHHTEK